MDEQNAIKIRQTGNPARKFANGLNHSELIGKSYEEIVSIFEKRITEWYFDTAESFQTNTKDHNFPIIIFCSIIIDLLSQYYYGESAHNPEKFKSFITEELKDINLRVNPPIISCHYHKSEWQEDRIECFADAFYQCFRCGVVHSGRILEYGRINDDIDAPVILTKWGGEHREITVHPLKLLKRLKFFFKDYISRLLCGEIKRKKNFIFKFKIEYGIDISNGKSKLV